MFYLSTFYLKRNFNFATKLKYWYKWINETLSINPNLSFNPNLPPFLFFYTLRWVCNNRAHELFSHVTDPIQNCPNFRSGWLRQTGQQTQAGLAFSVPNTFQTRWVKTRPMLYVCLLVLLFLCLLFFCIFKFMFNVG